MNEHVRREALIPSQVARAEPAVPARGLRVRNLIKEYDTPIGVKRVLDGISFDVAEGEKIAVLGRNGAGKSTLVKLIGGVEAPTRGEIQRSMSISWPVGFSGGFESTMSGIDSIRFIARLYGVNADEAVIKVDDFAELGKYLQLPIRTYSSGMRSRLAFGLTLAVDFDCLLIDEVISVGDQRFRARCKDELFGKRGNRAMILISHDIEIIKTYCKKALVLKNGRGRVFEDLDLAINIYKTL